MWLKFEPLTALFRAILFTTTLVIIFKVGESVPSDYAKYLLVWF